MTLGLVAVTACVATKSKPGIDATPMHAFQFLTSATTDGISVAEV